MNSDTNISYLLSDDNDSNGFISEDNLESEIENEKALFQNKFMSNSQYWH